MSHGWSPPARASKDVTCAVFCADRHTAPIEPFATGFARTSFLGGRGEGRPSGDVGNWMGLGATVI